MKRDSLTKRTLVFLISMIVLLFPIIVSATGSGYVNSPTTQPTNTQNQWTKGMAYKCYSAAQTAQGKNTYTYFRNQSSLRNEFVAYDDRPLVIHLMEEDGIFSADDHVKTYAGVFRGRDLTEIKVVNTEIEGDIESSGDNCAELYIRMRIGRVTGDSSTDYVQSGLFQYNVGIN